MLSEGFLIYLSFNIMIQFIELTPNKPHTRRIRLFSQPVFLLNGKLSERAPTELC